MTVTASTITTTDTTITTPTSTFNSSTSTSENSIVSACSICHSALAEEPQDTGSIKTRFSTPAIVTRCGHPFHEICILRWINSGNPSCPICRQTCKTSRLIPLFLWSINAPLSPPKSSRTSSDVEQELQACKNERNDLELKVVGLLDKTSRLTSEIEFLKLELAEHDTKWQIKLRDARQERKTLLSRLELFEHIEGLMELLKQGESLPQSNIESHQNLSKEDLTTYVAAVEAKLLKTTEDKTKLEARLKSVQESLERQSEHEKQRWVLSKRIKELERECKSLKRDRSSDQLAEKFQNQVNRKSSEKENFSLEKESCDVPLDFVMPLLVKRHRSNGPLLGNVTSRYDGLGGSKRMMR